MSVFGPTPIEDLPQETQEVARKAERLAESNAAMIGEIQRLGADVDMVTARVEHFFVSLANLGVITDDQLWNINLDWQQSARAQIHDLLQKVRARVEQDRVAAQARMRQQSRPARPAKAQPPRLWTPS